MLTLLTYTPGLLMPGVFLLLMIIIPFFPFKYLSFASFPYLIALARTFSTVLHMHGEKGYPQCDSICLLTIKYDVLPVFLFRCCI